MENYSLLMGDSCDEDGGGVDGEAFRGTPRPRSVPNRLLSPDLGFAMAAARELFSYRGLFVSRLGYWKRVIIPMLLHWFTVELVVSLPIRRATRQISLPANFSPESFKRRRTKASLDLSCSRLTEKSAPLPIRGLAGGLCVKSGGFFLAGITGNRHAIVAGNMSTSSPKFTGSSLNSPQPNSPDPTFAEPLAFLPPNVSDIMLAQPFSASSSNILGRIPTLQEIQEELEGQARMAAKVQEAEQKKGSKARNREGEKGQWWPSEVTESELKAFAKEGLIAPDTWSFHKDSSTPNPEPDERVLTKAWVERGLSLPSCEFFLSVLSTYGLQPHNICPNSFLHLSNFVTLCEGHLGIRRDIRLWQFFYRVKKGDQG
ncbi:hypothetical protein QYE76_063134 [Lolium multiflorum]|uniref:Transposase (putative) gypsy type domain-containing protein n=1 Tax=Lolium multiflorum TaxID=4521 RepID=A0AAD8S4C0_LOLMU|nr:hypothetical protein QYE76_063134 [Lolium multiflorum]